MTAPLGVLVMAYGTASGPDDIERYYTDIRGGHPPPQDRLTELRDRYRAIGNVFPLLDTTREQAAGLVERLNAGDGQDRYVAYLGMKHSPPSIPDAVARMHAEGVRRAVGIVMAPHWSGMSVETYVDRVDSAIEAQGSDLACSFVRSFHDHPAFVRFLATRVHEAVDRLGVAEPVVLFSAHSLPVRAVDDGSLRCLRCDCEPSCRYRDGLQQTADLVADEVGLREHLIAWQSAGRTDDPWWGPSVDEVIVQLAAEGREGVVVCSAGFVADHLETLYDLDIEANAIAAEAGIAFARTRMPNADPEFLEVLATVVREHLAQVPV